METFTYLGSTVRNDGGAGNDIMNRLNKARNIFRSLKTVWKSSQYSKQTKLKLYRIRMLEDDRERPNKPANFSHQKLKENPAHFLAK